jgi:hypothetical protein
MILSFETNERSLLLLSTLNGAASRTLQLLQVNGTAVTCVVFKLNEINNQIIPKLSESLAVKFE